MHQIVITIQQPILHRLFEVFDGLACVMYSIQPMQYGLPSVLIGFLLVIIGWCFDWRYDWLFDWRFDWLFDADFAPLLISNGRKRTTALVWIYRPLRYRPQRTAKGNPRGRLI
jgi:hypothetical protein